MLYRRLRREEEERRSDVEMKNSEKENKLPEKEHEEAPDQIPEEHNRISTGGGECEKNCSSSTKRTAAENTLVRGGAPPHLQITLQTKKYERRQRRMW